MVAVLAGAGEWVIQQAEPAYDAVFGAPQIAGRSDFAPVWEAADALVHGRGAYPFYGDHVVLGYAPPFVVMFAPFGLLARDIAIGMTAALAALVTGMVVLAWSRRDGVLQSWAPALLVSVPVVAVVHYDQLTSAIGLAAVSLAIWAQRRGNWWLVGAAAAVGLIRTSNGIPVVAMLLVASGLRPRQLAQAVVGGLVVLGPLVLGSFAWDPNWVADYAQNLANYPLAGYPGLIHLALGLPGDVAFLGAGCVLAAALAWGSRGRPLDLDRAALGLAITVVLSSQSLFGAIFALPAIARLAMRPGFGAVAWGVAVVPWLIILALAPMLLGGQPSLLNWLNLLVPFLAIAAFPLVGSAKAGAVAS